MPLNRRGYRIPYDISGSKYVISLFRFDVDVLIQHTKYILFFTFHLDSDETNAKILWKSSSLCLYLHFAWASSIWYSQQSEARGISVIDWYRMSHGRYYLRSNVLQPRSNMFYSEDLHVNVGLCEDYLITRAQGINTAWRRCARKPAIPINLEITSLWWTIQWNYFVPRFMLNSVNICVRD
jgi:hypothetical protein